MRIFVSNWKEKPQKHTQEEEEEEEEEGAYSSNDVGIDNGNAVGLEQIGNGAFPRRNSAGQPNDPHCPFPASIQSIQSLRILRFVSLRNAKLSQFDLPSTLSLRIIILLNSRNGVVVS